MPANQNCKCEPSVGCTFLQTELLEKTALWEKLKNRSAQSHADWDTMHLCPCKNGVLCRIWTRTSLLFGCHTRLSHFLQEKESACVPKCTPSHLSVSGHCNLVCQGAEQRVLLVCSESVEPVRKQDIRLRVFLSVFDVLVGASFQNSACFQFDPNVDSSLEVTKTVCCHTSGDLHSESVTCKFTDAETSNVLHGIRIHFRTTTLNKAKC